jgi:hypothetical protein
MGFVVSAIFLSASIPVVGRGDYHLTADPFLIQSAVRELVAAALGRRLIVWGGHPAITPMVWAVCEDLGIQYSRSVVLYQSRFFNELFPEENRQFQNVEYVPSVRDDREASLLAMRTAMLSRGDLVAAVFIGGMEGVLAEHELFLRFHPGGRVITVPAAGGAGLDLALQRGVVTDRQRRDVDFAGLFHRELGIQPNEPRVLGV